MSLPSETTWFATIPYPNFSIQNIKLLTKFRDEI